MKAHVGERIVVRGQRLGVPDRDGEILEVRGPDDSPPFLVKWSDTGHTGLYFPASDAYIAHDHTPSG
jgi:hypothetical protein